jgi:AraC-like DNA-binding protein
MSAEVRAALLSDFPALGLECGFDPLAELRTAGLSPAVLGDDTLLIPAERVSALLEGAALRSQRQDIGLQLAFRRQLGHLGLSGLVLSQQPTPRAALETAEQYRHLLTEALHTAVEEHDGQALVRCRLTIPSAGARQLNELAVAAVVQLFRLIAGEHWHPQQVSFAHRPPENLASHRRFFGCRLSFDDFYNGFTCPSGDLDRINPAAQTSLADQLRRLLDALPAPQHREPMERLRSTMILLLPLGRANLAACAQALGTSQRSLQRLLEREGTSFSVLLADLRAELAQSYLADRRLAVGRIAEHLGYAYPSAFVRWFQSYFGTSPQAWRDAAFPQPHQRLGHWA